MSQDIIDVVCGNELDESNEDVQETNVQEVERPEPESAQDSQEENEPNGDELPDETGADDADVADAETEDAVEEPIEEPEPDNSDDADGRKVPLAALQEERQKRRSAERQNTELSDKIDKLLDKLSSEPSPKAEVVESEDNDDDWMTVGKFKQMQEKSEAKAEAERQKQSAQVIQRKMAVSEEKALLEFTAEKCGESLDYASVAEAGQDNLSVIDRQAIIQSNDPGVEFYRRCIARTPELQARQNQVTAKRKAVTKQNEIPPPKKKPEPAELPDLDEIEKDPTGLVDMLYG